jgi:16S rRNA (uracil1498-N3)-methyltransferase
MRPKIRLHVAAGLGAGSEAALTPDQAHYLRNVLRLEPGAALALFNARDGEWLGHIERLGKSGGTVRLSERLRTPVVEPDLWLLFAPIKRARIDYLVEKATELGVRVLWPVFTARTDPARVNLDRLTAHAVEAAEQTERLSVPDLFEPVELSQALAAFPAGRRLFVCDETGAAPSLGEILAGETFADPAFAGPAAFLVGPEGGFTKSELDALSKLPFVTAIGLGPRVLRSETAALAALAVFQALAGDWRFRGRAIDPDSH